MYSSHSVFNQEHNLLIPGDAYLFGHPSALHYVLNLERSTQFYTLSL